MKARVLTGLKLWLQLEFGWQHLAGRIQATTLLTMLRFRDGLLVLDLGCGGGNISLQMANSGVRVIALDSSIDTIRKLKKRLHSLGLAGHVLPVVGSGVALPFRSACFGGIICNSVIEHVDEDKTVVTEMARVVASGGVVGITVPNQSRRFAYRLNQMWTIVFSLPKPIRRLVLRPYLANSESITEARRILEHRFDHKHLYTQESIRAMLQGEFSVTKSGYYMQVLGAIFHDMLYALRGFNLSLPLYTMTKLSALDRLCAPSVEGKGIAVCAAKNGRNINLRGKANPTPL